jgi:hypothetical protein
MKTGVDIFPWGVFSSPRRARLSGAVLIRLNQFWLVIKKSLSHLPFVKGRGPSESVSGVDFQKAGLKKVNVPLKDNSIKKRGMLPCRDRFVGHSSAKYYPLLPLYL